MHSENLNSSEQWTIHAIPASTQSEPVEAVEAPKVGALQFSVDSCMYVRLSQAELQLFWSNV